MPEPMTEAELLGLGLDVLATAVGVCLFWVCMAGLTVGALSLVRAYLGVGRGG